MNETLCRVRLRIAVVLGVTGLVAGCGGSANPVSPSRLPISSGGTATAIAALPGLGSNANLAVQATGHPSPADLQSRGWTCFEPPIPNPPTVCGPPNQPIPPADRPPTFTFWIFDQAGTFLGTRILIREDLYAGQPCQSPGEPYFFVDVIGYYECLHTPGR